MRALVLAAAGLALAACADKRPVDCIVVDGPQCYRELADGRLMLLRLDGSVWMPNGRPIVIDKPVGIFPFTSRRGAGFWAGHGLAMPAY